MRHRHRIIMPETSMTLSCMQNRTSIRECWYCCFSSISISLNANSKYMSGSVVSFLLMRWCDCCWCRLCNCNAAMCIVIMFWCTFSFMTISHSKWMYNECIMNDEMRITITPKRHVSMENQFSLVNVQWHSWRCDFCRFCIGLGWIDLEYWLRITCNLLGFGKCHSMIHSSDLVNVFCSNTLLLSN